MVARGEASTYVPERGDAVWLNFSPQAGHEQAGHEQAGHEQAGHEQAGHRPALVLSPASYNGKVGSALFCPITSRVKGYPFEVRLPGSATVSGVVLADQVKSLDWRKREAEQIERLPEAVTQEVIIKIQALLR